MMPVSTVNASNYHLLGNQLKGESHSKRMKRVRATANMNAFSPTLQPLGATIDSVNQLAGPLFFAVLVGAGVAARKSKNKGKDTLVMSAVGGTVTAIALQALLMQERQSSDYYDIGQAVVLGIAGAAAASLGHGLSRRSKLTLN
jgi:hypothetical protein